MRAVAQRAAVQPVSECRTPAHCQRRAGTARPGCGRRRAGSDPGAGAAPSPARRRHHARAYRHDLPGGNAQPVGAQQSTHHRSAATRARNPRDGLVKPKENNMADNAAMVPLGEDHPEIRDAVRQICTKYPGSYWREVEDADVYPEKFVLELTESGYLAALIPEEYGGSSLPIRAGAVILEEIHASGCNAGACHAQMYIMGTLLRYGSDEQKRRYLPDIATGKLRLQAFGVTEPTTGSDTTKLKTRAVRDGHRYIINGQKVWTSRALQSDLMLLLARTTSVEQVKRRTEGLSVFLVDMREARKQGMEIRKLQTMINHQATEIFFDNVPVPADALIGEENKGFRYILDGLNAERILVSAEAIGDAHF